jgi:hypothetical protein
MTDIAWGEHSKKILRLLLKLGYHHLKVDMDIIDENLRFYPNPIIKNLNDIITIGANQIKPYWQRRMLKQYGQLILWLIAKDTAYRDVFFWILNEILKKADELQVLIKPFVKPPEQWSPNLWHASKEKTVQLKKDGKLPNNTHSFEESVWVKAIQDKRHQKNIKR